MNEERPSKMLYTMGEVSEMFDVKPSLLRFWEKNFPILKPQKNKKGNRLFTPKDIENLKVIYHLVKERGMTLEGAKRQLSQSRKAVDRDSAIMERLEMIRAALLQIKAEIKEASSTEKISEVVDTENKDTEKTEKVETSAKAETESELSMDELFGELPAPAPEIKMENYNPDSMTEFDKMQTEKIKKRLVSVDLPSATGSLFDQVGNGNSELKSDEAQLSLFK